MILCLLYSALNRRVALRGLSWVHDTVEVASGK